MASLPILFLVALGAAPTLPDMYALSEAEDYVAMAEWIARVREATVDSETAGQILDNAHLDRVLFPVEIRGEAAGWYGIVSPVHEIGFGPEGAAGIAFATTERVPPLALEGACLGEDAAVLSSEVTVAEPSATQVNTFELAVGHLESCWAAGGVRLILHSRGDDPIRLAADSTDVVESTPEGVPVDREIAEAAGILRLLSTTGEAGLGMDVEIADLLAEGGVEGGVIGGVIGGFAEGGDLGLLGTGGGGGGTSEGLGGLGTFGISAGNTLAVAGSGSNEFRVLMARRIDVVGTLEVEAIRATVAPRLGELGGCPAHGVAGTYEEPGWLDFQLEVDASGSVSSVRVGGEEPVANPAACVTNLLRSTAFPPSDTGAVVEVRLGFVHR